VADYGILEAAPLRLLGPTDHRLHVCVEVGGLGLERSVGHDGSRLVVAEEPMAQLSKDLAAKVVQGDIKCA
jgi:hypothetical protein